MCYVQNKHGIIANTRKKGVPLGNFAQLDPPMHLTLGSEDWNW